MRVIRTKLLGPGQGPCSGCRLVTDSYDRTGEDEGPVTGRSFGEVTGGRPRSYGGRGVQEETRSSTTGDE